MHISTGKVTEIKSQSAQAVMLTLPYTVADGKLAFRVQTIALSITSIYQQNNIDGYVAKFDSAGHLPESFSLFHQSADPASGEETEVQSVTVVES